MAGNKTIKILAIDDHQDNLISLKALINEAFPDVEFYAELNGQQGIEAAKLYTPDIILLDILISGPNGYEVCKRLKADNILAEIPVVFLTALKGDKESRIRALECGGDAFLMKPIDESELTAQIRAMVKIKKANVEKRDETERLNNLVLERTLQLEQELIERKNAESQLLEKNTFIQTILDNLPIGIALNKIDEGNSTYMNKKFQEIYGWHSDEIANIASFFEKVYPDPEYRSQILERIMSDMNTGDPEKMHWENIEITCHDESKKIVNAVNIPLYDQNTMVSTVIDITSLKKAEKSLLETNELLSMFIHHSPIYAFIKEVTPTESRVIKASENYIDMIGIPGSQMIGKTMQELFPPEFATKITADDWAVTAKGEIITLDEELNGGYYTSVKFPIRQGDKTLLAGYTIDITKRKKAENELLKLSRAVEQSPDSILITNTNGVIEYVNPALLKLSGYEVHELIGKNPRIFNSGNTTKEEYIILWNTIKSGKIWDGEFLNKKKNGELFWESTSISPVFDSTGKITHYLAIRKNITEQKRMTEELILAKEHAEESDRLKTAFLANMSHEIRTPMNSIMGFASLLPEEESKVLINQYSNIIVQNSEQLVSLIDNIVLYSQLQTKILQFKPVWFEAHKLLIDIQQSFNLPIYQGKVKLIFTCNVTNTTQIYSDYDKLRQVIANLTTNALKYTNEGTIELACTQNEHDFQFQIKDTGIGIPLKDIDHIFERFYRGSNIEQSISRGTGLGLCIVKELVELLGGNIWVKSELNAGSTFFFTIPLKKVL